MFIIATIAVAVWAWVWRSVWLVLESLLPHIETTITTGAITGADMAPPMGMGMSRTRAITAITVVDMAPVIVIDVCQGGDRRKRRLPVERPLR
jgi:hypothetical protein